MKRRHQTFVAVLGTFLGFSFALSADQDARLENEHGAGRPNVIVIVVDDMRFDEFGAGGHPYIETPNIDLLAAEGAMFSNAFRE